MKTARLNNGFHVNHSQDSSAKNGEFSNNQGGALLSAHTLISWCSFTCALTFYTPQSAPDIKTKQHNLQSYDALLTSLKAQAKHDVEVPF